MYKVYPPSTSLATLYNQIFIQPPKKPEPHWPIEEWSSEVTEFENGRGEKYEQWNQGMDWLWGGQTQREKEQKEQQGAGGGGAGGSNTNISKAEYKERAKKRKREAKAAEIERQAQEKKQRKEWNIKEQERLKALKDQRKEQKRQEALGLSQLQSHSFNENKGVQGSVAPAANMPVSKKAAKKQRKRAYRQEQEKQKVAAEGNKPLEMATGHVVTRYVLRSHTRASAAASSQPNLESGSAASANHQANNMVATKRRTTPLGLPRVEGKRLRQPRTTPSDAIISIDLTQDEGKSEPQLLKSPLNKWQRKMKRKQKAALKAARRQEELERRWEKRRKRKEMIQNGKEHPQSNTSSATAWIIKQTDAADCKG